jgi:hypothetical protein
LIVVSVLGILGALALLGLALLSLALNGQGWWLALLAVFIGFRAITGFQQARVLARLAKAPRHTEFACPSCGAAPLAGDFWLCPRCRIGFDTFKQGGRCPQCGTEFPDTACPECRQRHPLIQWLPAAAPADVPKGTP